MGERGFLTIKAGMPGGTGKGPSRRMEFEYEIPARDAKALVQMSPLRVEKKRYLLDGGIELDVFEGPHEGLVIAEVEVEDGDAPAPEPPDGWEWIDVSGDLCYSNRALAEHGTPNDAPRAAIGP
jgi:CYTH domain-containing protein